MEGNASDTGGKKREREEVEQYRKITLMPTLYKIRINIGRKIERRAGGEKLNITQIKRILEKG